MSAVFVIITIEILIPEAHSLKDKRQVLKSLLERMRAKTNVAVAETDFNELWQRAQISAALVANEKNIIEKQVESLQHILDANSQIETTIFDYEYV